MSKHNEYIIPAGKYWLGDPCYIIPDEDWDDFLIKTDYFEYSLVEVKGYKVIGFHTYYGDGTYYDNFGNEYSVDSGTIGLVPVEIGIKNIHAELAKSVEFREDVLCYEDSGILHFGEYIIDTKEDEDPWDKEDLYDEYDALFGGENNYERDVL
jgi:hypothetical protein